MPAIDDSHDLSAEGYLTGQFLIAMPSMRDPNFARSVVLICAHSEEGAMGLIVNKLAERMSFYELLTQIGVLSDQRTVPAVDDFPIQIGGPVETSRGFVLHTADYMAPESTLPVDERLSLTATVDVLRAIAGGTGPSRSLLTLGYAGWRPGQLEHEIQMNGWLISPADPDIVFDRDVSSKYDRALAYIGVQPAFLVSDAGHA
ncbi:MAG: YqgE/AlgH family protein [Rhizobiales bacterium]|nr:YqgE/AlgH family protein [Hyphomicrobiales bacterium]